MTLHSLPIFVRLAGRRVILVGEGEAADAKRRLLERAGAMVVSESDSSPSPSGEGLGVGEASQRPPPAAPPLKGRDEEALAIVVDDDDAVARLKARGILVNAVDRPELCDFTLPAIVDRAPVIVAIGTGGVSAGLAAALRQRIETLLPAGLGRLAEALHAARDAWRARYPDAADRRRAIGAALSQGGALDPLADRSAAAADPPDITTSDARIERIALRSTDPDDLTLREARWLAAADRVVHRPTVPGAILDRARADAIRIASDAPLADDTAGLTVDVGWT